MGAWENTIWLVSAWAMASLGVGLAAWALLWDRARGRRRCPRCWYDMAGVPGRICPECGREAASERALAKTRRHWRLTAVAVFCMLSARPLAVAPGLKSVGWPILIPSAVLVFVTTPIWRSPPELLPQGPTPSRLQMELARRYTNRKLSDWHRQIITRRDPHIPPRVWLDQIEVPDRWPTGVPIPGVSRGDYLLGGDQVVLTPVHAADQGVKRPVVSRSMHWQPPEHFELHPSETEGPLRVRVELFDRAVGDKPREGTLLYWSGVVELPVEIGGDADSFFRSLEKDFAARVSVSASMREPNAGWQRLTVVAPALHELGGQILYVQVNIVKDGIAVAEYVGGFMRESGQFIARLQPRDFRLPLVNPDTADPRWELQITSEYLPQMYKYGRMAAPYMRHSIWIPIDRVQVESQP